MEIRRVSRRALLTSFISAGASATAVAQQIVKPVRPDGQQPEPPVLSGSDIGFRVDREERDGARTGGLVVRVDGKWVEARFGMSAVRGVTRS
jgi:hypothetical protein